MMKFEDGPYYIGGKNRVDEMWTCMNNEVVLNDKNFNVMVSGITHLPVQMPLNTLIAHELHNDGSCYSC